MTVEPIPLVDLVAQYREHQDELLQAIHQTLEQAAFIGGPTLKRFEADFAKWCGVQDAIGVGNGTDALYLALRALGIGPGDEVITAANSFIATAEAISLTGARVVFVDVDPDTALIEVDQVQAARTERTRAVIPVHLYGQLVQMAPLLEWANRHDIFVVEDAAQAHGATQDGIRAGAFGDAGCFSFYPGKNLGAYGDAGAVVTSQPELAQKIRMTANHGRADKFGHVMEGVNSRLDGLQAAILEVKLRHLDAWTERRRQAARRYDALLDGIPAIRRLRRPSDDGHVFHLYVVRVERRDALRAHLKAHHIHTGIHYPVPLPRLEAYAHLGHPPGRFPVSEALAASILSLPLYPEITEAQQVRVVDGIRAFVESTS